METNDSSASKGMSTLPIFEILGNPPSLISLSTVFSETLRILAACFFEYSIVSLHKTSLVIVDKSSLVFDTEIPQPKFPGRLEQQILVDARNTSGVAPARYITT